MKKILIKSILSAVALLIAISTTAQITQGGKELPDEVVVKIDTFTKTKTIVITTPENTSGNFVAMYYSFAMPSSALSAVADPNASIQDSYQGATGLGMKTGGRFGIHVNWLLNGINQNMIRELDWGMNYAFEVGSNGFTLEHPDLDDSWSDLNTTYYNFWDVSLGGIGPSLTYHTPAKGLDIDVFANFGGNMLLGGGFEHPNGITVENFDGVKMGFYKTFGLSLRYYSLYLALKTKSYNLNNNEYSISGGGQGTNYFMSRLSMRFTNLTFGLAF